MLTVGRTVGSSAFNLFNYFVYFLIHLQVSRRSQSVLGLDCVHSQMAGSPCGHDLLGL